MSINLTSILQRVQGLNTFFKGPNASRENGVVLEDSATITWTTDGFGNIQGTAGGGTITGPANEVYATPDGATGNAALRKLVAGDLPAGTPQLIQTINAGGLTGITFSDIPQTFANLMVKYLASSANGGLVEMFIRFNGDSSFNYSWAGVQNSNGTIQNIAATTANQLCIGMSGSQNEFSAGTIDIPGYALNGNHAAIGTAVGFQGSNNMYVSAGGSYQVIAPITSLSIYADGSAFESNTVFSLYGL